MTDIEIVDELRRLYEAVPQGEWTLEPYAGFTSGAMGYDIRIGPNLGDVIAGTGRALLDYDEREIGNLIVAMHNALPVLLDAVEVTQSIARFRSQVSLRGYGPEDADALNDELERLEEMQRAALAALERSDA